VVIELDNSNSNENIQENQKQKLEDLNSEQDKENQIPKKRTTKVSPTKEGQKQQEIESISTPQSDLVNSIAKEDSQNITELNQIQPHKQRNPQQIMEKKKSYFN